MLPRRDLCSPASPRTADRSRRLATAWPRTESDHLADVGMISEAAAALLATGPTIERREDILRHAAAPALAHAVNLVCATFWRLPVRHFWIGRSMSSQLRAEKAIVGIATTTSWMIPRFSG